MKIAACMTALLIVVAPGGAIGQTSPTPLGAPLSPYPQCQANKASKTPCMCGVQPATVCPANSWCSFTPEGAPSCSRTRPLHR